MPLQVGDLAPDFTLFVRPRETVSLHDYAGQPVVILFFPLAFSSTCTTEIKATAEDYALYRSLGCEIIGVSVDSPFVNERFAEACNAHFPILSDFHREVGPAYGVMSDGAIAGLHGVHNRAAFLLDSGHRVAFAWMNENPNVLPPFARIKDALRKLQSPTPASTS